MRQESKSEELQSGKSEMQEMERIREAKREKTSQTMLTEI